MPTFQRRAITKRLKSFYWRQPIQEIHTSDGDVGFLIGNTWYRYQWSELRSAILKYNHRLLLISPYQLNFLHYSRQKWFLNKKTPKQAIDLSIRREAEKNQLHQKLRRHGLKRIDLLLFQVGKRKIRLNVSSWGYHFTHNEILRKILIQKLQPEIHDDAEQVIAKLYLLALCMCVLLIPFGVLFFKLFVIEVSSITNFLTLYL